MRSFFDKQKATISLSKYIVYNFLQFDRSVGQTQKSMLAMGMFLIFVIPKMIDNFKQIFNKNGMNIKKCKLRSKVVILLLVKKVNYILEAYVLTGLGSCA